MALAFVTPIVEAFIAEKIGALTLEKVITQAKDVLIDITQTKDVSKKATFTVGCNIKAMDSEAVKKMDNKLMLIITSTTKTLEKKDFTTATWQDILDVMDQNTTIQPKDEKPFFNTNILIKESSNWFGSGEPDQAVIQEVFAWFKELVSDEDILANTKIDIDFLAKVVAATGIIVDGFVSFFFGNDYKEHTLIDVGIIRYPDIDNPYFKVYRIALTAWAKCVKIMGNNQNSTGISGECSVKKYIPRDSVIKDIKQEVQKNAVDEATKLLLGLK